MPRNNRMKKFAKDVITQTPLVRMALLLAALWLLFSWGVFAAERGMAGTAITSYGRALYWGVAAFSTAGIADTPLSGWAQLIGGVWIVVGSMLFFGIIVATVTAYFMRPLNRPGKQIIDTIEYNLEQIGDLTVEELDLLKDTTDALIEHMEEVKRLKTERETARQ